MKPSAPRFHEDESGLHFFGEARQLPQSARATLTAYLRREAQRSSDFDAAEFIIGELLSIVGTASSESVEAHLSWMQSTAVFTVRCHGGECGEDLTGGGIWGEARQGLAIVLALGANFHISQDGGDSVASVELPVHRRILRIVK
jgi:hypothetical protein